MELSTVLIIYVVVTVILIVIFIRIHIETFSSVVLDLLFGQILLNILVPPNKINPFCETNSVTALYFLIQIATPIILLVYILIKAFSDRKISYTNKIVT